MKRIYIAGKITGECETPELIKKCIDKFNNYGNSLSFGRFSRPINGFCVNNDSTLSFTHGFLINQELISSGEGTWNQYMKNDITNLVRCDEIHFLPDWKDSKGCQVEHYLAEKIGIKIVYILS